MAAKGIWVHVAPIIEPDNDEAKTALTTSVKEEIGRTLVKLTGQALPPDKFNPNPGDKPTGKSADFNAIKITATLKTKIETAGAHMTFTGGLFMNFEAIKAPELKKGAELLGSGSKGAGVRNRGTGDKAIVSNAEQTLLEIVAPLVKKIIDNPTFNSYAKSKNLPI